MRRLRPDSRGIIKAQKQTIRHGGHVKVYNKPDISLKRIDRLRNGEIPKIAFTRKQGGIGDVLMTTPTVKAVSTKYNTQVDYGTDFKYLDGALPRVLENIPYINRIVPWQDIKVEDYDAVIDLTCPCVGHEVPKAPPVNRVDLFAQYVGIPLVNTDLDYVMTQEEEEWADRYLNERFLDRNKLILVQPSSNAVARDAPIDKMKRSLAYVLNAKKDVRALVITHNTDNNTTDWNIKGVHIFDNHPVREIAAIMSKCDLVFCPDSSILHLAAAQHKPTVTLFGPTDPYARVNYHPEAVAIWPGKELAAYPIWYNPSPDGYLCWKRLEEETIIKTIIAMLDGSPLPQSRDLVTFGDFDSENQYYKIL